jgi:hypothetical protein
MAITSGRSPLSPPRPIKAHLEAQSCPFVLSRAPPSSSSPSPTRAAALEVHRRPKLGRCLDLHHRSISAGQIVSGSSSCGERTLPHLYSSLPQAVAPPRCAPPGRRPPPWAQSAGHRPNRLPKPLVSFGASFSSRRTKPRPKPCPGAHFRANAGETPASRRRLRPSAAAAARGAPGPSDHGGRPRSKWGVPL